MGYFTSCISIPFTWPLSHYIPSPSQRTDFNCSIKLNLVLIYTRIRYDFFVSAREFHLDRKFDCFNSESLSRAHRTRLRCDYALTYLPIYICRAACALCVRANHNVCTGCERRQDELCTICTPRVASADSNKTCRRLTHFSTVSHHISTVHTSRAPIARSECAQMSEPNGFSSTLFFYDRATLLRPQIVRERMSKCVCFAAFE